MKLLVLAVLPWLFSHFIVILGTGYLDPACTTTDRAGEPRLNVFIGMQATFTILAEDENCNDYCGCMASRGCALQDCDWYSAPWDPASPDFEISLVLIEANPSSTKGVCKLSPPSPVGHYRVTCLTSSLANGTYALLISTPSLGVIIRSPTRVPYLVIQPAEEPQTAPQAPAPPPTATALPPPAGLIPLPPQPPPAASTPPGPPAISSLVPNLGPVGGVTLVEARGVGFYNARLISCQLREHGAPSRGAFNVSTGAVTCNVSVGIGAPTGSIPMDVTFVSIFGGSQRATSSFTVYDGAATLAFSPPWMDRNGGTPAVVSGLPLSLPTASFVTCRFFANNVSATPASSFSTKDSSTSEGTDQKSKSAGAEGAGGTESLSHQEVVVVMVVAGIKGERDGEVICPGPAFPTSPVVHLQVAPNGQQYLADTLSLPYVEDFPPRAGNEHVSTLDGQQVSVQVLANSSAAYGSLRLTGVAQSPAFGSARVDKNSSVVVYQPGSGYVGRDWLAFSVSDKRGRSSTGTLSIAVLPRPPRLRSVPTAVFSATQDSYYPLRGTLLQGTAIEYAAISQPLAASVWADHGRLLPTSAVASEQMVLYGGPQAGVNMTGNGSALTAALQHLQYVSAVGYVGNDTVHMSVTDGDGQGGAAAVHVQVLPDLQAPSITVPNAVYVQNTTSSSSSPSAASTSAPAPAAASIAKWTFVGKIEVGLKKPPEVAGLVEVRISLEVSCGVVAVTLPPLAWLAPPSANATIQAGASANVGVVERGQMVVFYAPLSAANAALASVLYAPTPLQGSAGGWEGDTLVVRAVRAVCGTGSCAVGSSSAQAQSSVAISSAAVDEAPADSRQAAGAAGTLGAVGIFSLVLLLLLLVLLLLYLCFRRRLCKRTLFLAAATAAASSSPADQEAPLATAQPFQVSASTVVPLPGTDEEAVPEKDPSLYAFNMYKQSRYHGSSEERREKIQYEDAEEATTPHGDVARRLAPTPTPAAVGSAAIPPNAVLVLPADSSSAPSEEEQEDADSGGELRTFGGQQPPLLSPNPGASGGAPAEEVVAWQFNTFNERLSSTFEHVHDELEAPPAWRVPEAHATETLPLPVEHNAPSSAWQPKKLESSREADHSPMARGSVRAPTKASLAQGGVASQVDSSSKMAALRAAINDSDSDSDSDSD